jgi:acetyl-CoA carboxylase carboxyl transferase subunit alpha
MDTKNVRLLDFEAPIFEITKKIDELEQLSHTTGMNLNGELVKLKGRLDAKVDEVFSGLTPWQRIQLARHEGRPDTVDYVAMMIDGFLELHGDRAFRDDPAILCGLGKLDGRTIMLVGHRKGKDYKERTAYNFGCAHPEGYNKAARTMRLAAKFGVPIVTLINTQGAYPGIGAEERGQAWAIAENMMLMAGLPVPIVCVVIGEGGSGGALGIGIGDRVLMLEHSYYSVISPEGCAAILWGSAEKAQDAARALRITSQDLRELGVIDAIIPEPTGGAHRKPLEMGQKLREVLSAELRALSAVPSDRLLNERYEKFRRMGSVFAEHAPALATPVPADVKDLESAVEPK